MKCPECQFDNREGVKFCEECGAKFELRCPNCKAKIPFGRKFCGECGFMVLRFLGWFLGERLGRGSEIVPLHTRWALVITNRHLHVGTTTCSAYPSNERHPNHPDYQTNLKQNIR